VNAGVVEPVGGWRYVCANNAQKKGVSEGGIVGWDKEVGKLKVALSKSGKNIPGIGYCEIITSVDKTF
jgi:hypothetical protein